MKTGRLGKEEWEFIDKNADTLTPEQLASKLGRTLESVEKYLMKIGKSVDRREAFATQAEYDIKGRPYWGELKLQFSEKELELFLFHWKQIVAQFKKDVLATEELQIVDTVKLEILMNRALREQQESSVRLRELDVLVQAERRKSPEDQDREYVFNLERQVASFMAAKDGLSREFKDLQTKKSALFKDMKATRAERIDKIENNKETFSSLVNKILKDPDFFEQEGKALEKMRMAVEAERVRLSSLHKYDDGMLDFPMLNSQTVLDADKEEDVKPGE